MPHAARAISHHVVSNPQPAVALCFVHPRDLPGIAADADANADTDEAVLLVPPTFLHLEEVGTSLRVLPFQPGHGHFPDWAADEEKVVLGVGIIEVEVDDGAHPDVRLALPHVASADRSGRRHRRRRHQRHRRLNSFASVRPGLKCSLLGLSSSQFQLLAID